MDGLHRWCGGGTWTKNDQIRRRAGRTYVIRVFLGMVRTYLAELCNITALCKSRYGLPGWSLMSKSRETWDCLSSKHCLRQRQGPAKGLRKDLFVAGYCNSPEHKSYLNPSLEELLVPTTKVLVDAFSWHDLAVPTTLLWRSSFLETCSRPTAVRIRSRTELVVR